MRNNHKGRYNMDYSPKYQNPYDIYEKAKSHMKQQRRQHEKTRCQDAPDAVKRCDVIK